MIPSTNSRSPWSVGSRPALVCGAASSPASCRSWSTERIEAGERLTPAVPANVFDPTGCPLARYPSTTSRKISRARALSSEIGGVGMEAFSVDFV